MTASEDECVDLARRSPAKKMVSCDGSYASLSRRSLGAGQVRRARGEALRRYVLERLVHAVHVPDEYNSIAAGV